MLHDDVVKAWARGDLQSYLVSGACEYLEQRQRQIEDGEWQREDHLEWDLRHQTTICPRHQNSQSMESTTSESCYSRKALSPTFGVGTLCGAPCRAMAAEPATKSGWLVLIYAA